MMMVIMGFMERGDVGFHEYLNKRSFPFLQCHLDL